MISEQVDKDLNEIVSERVRDNPDIDKQWAKDLIAQSWHRGFSAGYEYKDKYEVSDGD